MPYERESLYAISSISLTNGDVRLLVDVLAGEQIRLNEFARDNDIVDQGDWLQQRRDLVGALKERLKEVLV